MAGLIVSVSGLRGIIGGELTPLIAARYAAAHASALPPGPVVVARDSRPSGPMLAAAVTSALQALGRDVFDAGIAATPTVGVLIRNLGAAGGIQISASHNPLPYNGLKLFSAEGRVIPAALGEEVLARFQADDFPWASHDRIGRALTLPDPHAAHLAAVLATVDADAIRARRFPVLLDANHGAGALLGRPLLEALGCQVTIVGEAPDGAFAHPAEPTEENLRTVGARVVAAGAELGFCQDPDADRLAVIDAEGNYLGEEYTLALCFDHVLRARPGPIVVNGATSRMADDLALKYGVPLARTAVGEANVVDGMLSTGAVFGGEGNGGPIDPRVGLVRDSFVGMALLLESLATRGARVADLVAELPRYSMLKLKAELPREQLTAALSRLPAGFPGARVETSDGVRLSWDDRWLLVRASNTEPLVRVIVEAPTEAAARELAEKALRNLGAP